MPLKKNPKTSLIGVSQSKSRKAEKYSENDAYNIQSFFKRQEKKFHGL
jgi:hypothetical protein